MKFQLVLPVVNKTIGKNFKTDIFKVEGITQHVGMKLNCQVQCSGCNVFKYGEQYVFGNKLDQKFGTGTARRLHIKAQQIVKLSDSDLEDMIKRYKNFVDCM